MTLPALLSRHVHVSEREVAHTWPDGQKDDSRWEDCLWCSVVEWLNDTRQTPVADTLAYAEYLRDLSGEPPTGGSNAWDVQRALAKIGIPVTPIKGGAATLAALKPGYCAFVAGRMGVFPDGHRLRRWLPSFEDGHSVYLARLLDSRLWWCDPLAPKGTYNGEIVSEADAKRFIDGLPGGGNVVAPISTLTKENIVYPLIAFLPGQKATIKVQSNIRSEPRIAATKFRTTTATETQTLIGTVKGDVDPKNNSNVWYMWWANGRYEFTAKDNVSAVTVTAADDGFTKATQDAAVAAAVAEQKTADAATLLSATKKAAEDAVEQERARVRSVLGV